MYIFSRMIFASVHVVRKPGKRVVIAHPLAIISLPCLSSRSPQPSHAHIGNPSLSAGSVDKIKHGACRSAWIWTPAESFFFIVSRQPLVLRPFCNTVEAKGLCCWFHRLRKSISSPTAFSKPASLFKHPQDSSTCHGYSSHPNAGRPARAGCPHKALNRS